MFEHLNVTVIGGDARQLEVIGMFMEERARVAVFGMDRASGKLPEGIMKTWSIETAEEALRRSDVVILPALSCDEFGRISGGLTLDYIELTDHLLNQLKSDCVIFSGTAHPEFRLRCQERGIRLMELFERDDVAIYNSVPTAEGAVMMAIRETDRTIHDANVIVLGMGRTGLTLARVLKAMGAKVRIGIHRSEQAARAFEMGFETFHTDELTEQVKEIHLLFNTIPSMIVTAQVIVRMPLDTVIIDLASKPGGVDYRYAEKIGVKAMLAPGLPGLVAPRTAGQIMAVSIRQLLVSSGKGKVTA